MGHTPGPWLLCAHLRDHDKCSCGYRGGIWSEATDVMVCEIGAPNRDEGDDMIPRSPRETQFADARLIAAAPDLLAVAKECLELAKLAGDLTGGRGDDDYVFGIEDRLNAAIAKAEGR